MSYEAKQIESKLAEIRARYASDRAARATAALSSLMTTEDGREALYWILDKTCVRAEELWHPSAAELGRRATLRDFGQMLEDNLALANEPAFFDFQRVQRRRAMDERLELDNEERKLKEKLA